MHRSNAPKRLTTFLQKTYDMVSDPQNASSVSWTGDGTAICIHNLPEFTDTVLPRYFKHNNFASFVRQLNMYDFHKCEESCSGIVFRHPSFVCGKKALIKSIHRKTCEVRDAGDTTSLSKADCQRLITKLQDLQHDHESLEETVHVLRGENHDMIVHNQGLVSQLQSYKAREERLEGLLRTFSGQLRNVYSKQEMAEALPSCGGALNALAGSQPTQKLADSDCCSMEDSEEPRSANEQSEEADIAEEVRQFLGR